MSSWYKRRFLGEAMLKCTLRQLFPGWQGVWKDLGRFLAQVSPPRAWDFTPEWAPTLANRCVTWWRGALPTPVNSSSFAPCWGLACAYRASVQCSERAGLEAGLKQQQQQQELPQEWKRNWTKKAMDPIERTGGEMVPRSPSQSRCFCNSREAAIATTNAPESNHPLFHRVWSYPFLGKISKKLWMDPSPKKTTVLLGEINPPNSNHPDLR